jgi:sialidase-1
MYRSVCLVLALAHILAAGDFINGLSGTGLFKGSDADHPDTVYIDGQPEVPHAYQVPALLTTREGTIIAFAEARLQDTTRFLKVAIVMKRSTDTAKTWSDVQLIHVAEKYCDELNNGDCMPSSTGPTVVQDVNTGAVWCAFSLENYWVYAMHSDDEGQSWSTPDSLIYMINPWGEDALWRTGAGRGLQLYRGTHAGRLIIPISVWTRNYHNQSFYSLVIFSDDHGDFWQIGGTVDYAGLIQPSMVQRANGDVVINCRNETGQDQGSRIEAVSDDGGETFYPPRVRENMPENTGTYTSGTKASLIRYTLDGVHDTNRILYCHGTQEGGWINLSYDEGESWPVQKTPHSSCRGITSMTVLPDYRVGILLEDHCSDYTGSGYPSLDFGIFTLKWLTDGQDSIGFEPTPIPMGYSRSVRSDAAPDARVGSPLSIHGHTISVDAATPVQLRLYSVNGALVHTRRIATAADIDLHALGLGAGRYIATVKDPAGAGAAFSRAFVYMP